MRRRRDRRRCSARFLVEGFGSFRAHEVRSSCSLMAATGSSLPASRQALAFSTSASYSSPRSWTIYTPGAWAKSEGANNHDHATAGATDKCVRYIVSGRKLMFFRAAAKFWPFSRLSLHRKLVLPAGSSANVWTGITDLSAIRKSSSQDSRKHPFLFAQGFDALSLAF